MIADPDVTPVGFAATDAPGATLRRRRSPFWLLLAVLVTVASLAGIGWFVAEQAGNAPSDAEAVGTGRVAGLGGPATPVVTFTAQAGKHTVWLDTSGIARAGTRETIVAATTCGVRFADGGTARFRGARQGSSVTIGDRSTVGVFDAPAGAAAIACVQRPFGRFGGRFRLRNEHPFLVIPGDPSVGWAPWVAVFAGSFALFGVPWLVGRWRGGRLVRR